MAGWVVVLLFSVGAVLLFVVGLSLSLIVRGRHFDGEISSNPHMRARGITCAVADAMGAPGGSSRDAGCGTGDQDSSCANCADRCISVIKS
jgi:hypothetical protein